jgi:hypothetical protein
MQVYASHSKKTNWKFISCAKASQETTGSLISIGDIIWYGKTYFVN